MKNVTMLVGALALLPAIASAGEWQTSCYNKKIPYQVKEKVQADGGDVLGRMIVGGALGKVIGGNDKGAAIGAVLGGISAAEKTQTVTKYKSRRVCTEKYIASHINDEVSLMQFINALNAGQKLSFETTADVQSSIGVTADGVWGSRSREAGIKFNSRPRSRSAAITAPEAPVNVVYGVMVNGVLATTFVDATLAADMIRALKDVAEVSIVVNP